MAASERCWRRPVAKAAATIMTPHRSVTTLVAVFVAAWSVAVQAQSTIGKELSVPQHLADGDELVVSLDRLIAHGGTLFSAVWTSQEGGGRPQTKGTGAPLSDLGNPLVFPRNFNRVSGDVGVLRGQRQIRDEKAVGRRERATVLPPRSVHDAPRSGPRPCRRGSNRHIEFSGPPTVRAGCCDRVPEVSSGVAARRHAFDHRQSREPETVAAAAMIVRSVARYQ